MSATYPAATIRSRRDLLVLLGALAAGAAWAFVPRDTAVELGATVTPAPPSITIAWTPPLNGLHITNQTVARKTLEATTWDAAVTLPTNAWSFVDTAVATGAVYEYRVWQDRVDTSGMRRAYGYIAAGLARPAVHARGTAVVLADATLVPLAAADIERFVQDLAGDGWTVIRHDVPRTSSVAAVRALLQADRQADPAVRAAVLLGSIPQPYSGYLAPDGHSDHRGAWPTDAYYADLDGIWTDTSINSTAATDARNDNVPGDGKFDQSYIPSALELEVGRVDLRQMSVFFAAGETTAQSEARLLRRYLDKNHRWRHGLIQVSARGLVDDNFKTYTEAFGATGWRNFAALVGRDNVAEQDFFTTLGTTPHLLAYGCGGGSASGCNGVGTTTDFAQKPVWAVFTLLFGSYFGDWGYVNNFLRAPLANAGYPLVCGWAGRPHWVLHPMGMGETIGYCARQSADNVIYEPTYHSREVHVGLMGDPTLRLHGVAPPAGAAAATVGPAVTVTWEASADAGAPGFLGYHVYRAAALGGAWDRLTADPLAGASCTDAAPPAGALYMVRAVRRQPAASGTYENLSQGVFAVADNTPPTIGAIADQATVEDVLSATGSVTVADAETPAASLWLTASASDPALVPPGNVVFGGAGAARTVWVAPAANRSGICTVTVTVCDGFLSASTGFVLTVQAVNDPPAPVNVTRIVTIDAPSTAVTLTATDADGDPITFGLATAPTNGTLAGAPPSLTYTFTNPPYAADGFRFTASDGMAAATGTVTITIRYPVAIAQQPQSRTNDLATEATFTVAAAGTTPYYYRWFKNGSALFTTTATNPTCVITSVTAADAGLYHCRVSNILNTVTSQTAMLAVNAQPSLATLAPTQVMAQSAWLGGTIVATNGYPVLERGVVCGTNAGTLWADGQRYAETGVFGTGAFGFLATNLAAGRTQYFLAYAASAAGTSSTVARAFLTRPAAPIARPPANGTLAAFWANWEAVQGATNYRLDAAADPGFTESLPGYSNRIAGLALTCGVTGLQARTAYYYRVRAENATGPSADSATQTVTAAALEAAPGLLAFTGTYGGADPAAQTVTVSNRGQRGLAFSHAAAYAPGAAGWWTLAPAGGVLDGGAATTLAGTVSLAGLAAGVYAVTNTLEAPETTNGPVCVVATLTLGKADQAITGFALTNGAAFVATDTVALAAQAGSGLPVAFAVASGPGLIQGAVLQFTGAGTACVTASQGGDANWNAAAPLTSTLVVVQAAASVRLGALAHVYDGTAKPVTVATEPPGLTVAVSYNGQPEAPALAGTYAVAAAVQDALYQGSAGATLVIAKAAAEVLMADLRQPYDGTPRAVSVASFPPVQSIVVTYDGQAAAPVHAGRYTVVGRVADPCYRGAATGTLVVVPAAQTIAFAPIPDQVVTAKVRLAATASSGLPVAFLVRAGPGVIQAGAMLAFTGTGRVAVAATQPGTANWEAAPTEVRELAVHAGPAPIRGLWNADFDGDGQADPAVYDAHNGTWSVALSTAGYARFTFAALLGGPGWTAAPADYDGDGLADPAVCQDATGAWQMLLSGSGYALRRRDGLLGGPGWAPASADYDGDRRSEYAVYQESSGGWTLRLSSGGDALLALPAFLGGPGWAPASADYDGDRLADPAVYQRAGGTWKVLLSGAGYAPVTLPRFGGAGWDPVPGDYDGDGLADPALRAAGGSPWRLLLSGGGYAPISVPLGL